MTEMVLTEELAFIPSFQSSSFSIWGFLSGLITPPHVYQDQFIRDSLGLGVSCVYKTFCCSSRKASKFTGNADVLRNDDCAFKVTEGKKMEVARDFHPWLGANNRNLCRHISLETIAWSCWFIQVLGGQADMLPYPSGAGKNVSFGNRICLGARYLLARY